MTFDASATAQNSANDQLFRILTKEQADFAKSKGVFCFSPSQIDTYRLCPRKWAFGAIDGVYIPSGGKGAELGTACHTVWENYLRDGTMPPDKGPLAKITKAPLKYLPLPKVAKVEGETKLWTPLGVLTTRIDFGIEDQGAFPRAALGELPEAWKDVVDFAGIPMIGDHKTSTNIDSYGKTPTDLVGNGTEDQPGDAQAAGYGLVAHVRVPNARAIDLFWSYVQTKSVRAQPVRARFDLISLDRALVFFWRDVEAMSRWKRTTARANDVTANPLACEAFGGCKHLTRCSITNEEKLTAMGNPDLTALLGLTTAAPAIAAAPAPAVQQPAASAPSAALDLNALLAVGPPPAPVAAAPAPQPAAAITLVLPTAPPPAPVVVAPPAPPAQTPQSIALAFFNAGQQLPAGHPGITPEITAAYAALVRGAAVLAPDAPIVVAPPPAPAVVVAPVVAAAPAVVQQPVVQQPVVQQPAAEQPKAEEPKPKKTRASKGSAEARALAEAAFDKAVEHKDYDLISKLAAALA